MAMKVCRECGKEVSTEAKTCPACGVKSPTKTKSGIGAKIVFGIVAAFAALFVIGAVTGDQSSSTARAGLEPAASGGAATAAIYKPGEEIQMRNGLSLKFRTALVREAVGPQGLTQEAAEGGVLVVIRYSITNISDKPVPSYEMPTITLTDDKGTTYSPDAGKYGFYAMEAKLDQKIMSDLNPGISISNAQVFEVSKASFNRATWMVTAENKQLRVSLNAVPE